MKQSPLLGIRRTRIAPPQGICPRELKVLCEFLEYLGHREVTGTTLLDAANVGRQAYLWTLSDGEHLLLLLQAQRFCYWEPTHETYEQLHERARDWLSEPPVEARLLRSQSSSAF
jgi:hypothetical protein